MPIESGLVFTLEFAETFDRARACKTSKVRSKTVLYYNRHFSSKKYSVSVFRTKRNGDRKKTYIARGKGKCWPLFVRWYSGQTRRPLTRRTGTPLPCTVRLCGQCYYGVYKPYLCTCEEETSCKGSLPTVLYVYAYSQTVCILAAQQQLAVVCVFLGNNDGD